MVLLAYVGLAALYTWPLLTLYDSHIVGNAGDDVLNASILWWNATTLPLTSTWWNQPHFYPAHGVTAFTENLLGLGPIATPVFWITGDPIATYNITLFLTWPLSAFAAYLLGHHLSGRRDVAFVAGLAYGFSTYRVSSLGHIQTVASFWLPIALLGLHQYLRSRSKRALILFAAAWVLQSLANGHYLLFSLVLIALWLLYFCTTKTHLSAGLVIAAVWIAGGLTLVPVMLRYWVIHRHYGLWRDLTDMALSAPLSAWGEVAHDSLWIHVLPYGRHNLFPGVTATVLLTAGVLAMLIRRRPDLPSPPWWRRAAIMVLASGLLASVVAIVVTLLVGPWRTTLLRVSVHATDVNRPIGLALVCGIGVLWLAARTRHAVQQRSAMLFYAAATIVMGVFAMGPVMYVGEDILFEHAPYGWLLSLPGYTSLRVPARFWMLGVLCLSIAAALAYGALSRSRAARPFILAVAIAGLLVDGWLISVPMVPAPERAWPVVEPPGAGRPPVLELPLRERTRDLAAQFRSIEHRRRVVNGVSGHDPPHYALVAEALERRDPEIVQALATLGTFEIVVERSTDPDSWDAFVSGLPGVRLIASDADRAAYKVPAADYQEPRLGAVLAIAAHPGTPAAAIDGNLETAWSVAQSQPDQWLSVELARASDIGGITLFQPRSAEHYPRRLAIEVSLDGRAWITVWEGSTLIPAFRGAVRQPRDVPVSVAFPAVKAVHVRLRQLAHHPYPWVVADVQVHAALR
jgi:hypothetical protein